MYNNVDSSRKFWSDIEADNPKSSLYRKIVGRIGYVASTFLNSLDMEEEDAIHDCLCRCASKYHLFDPSKSSLPTWCVNVARNRLRTLEKHRRVILKHEIPMQVGGGAEDGRNYDSGRLGDDIDARNYNSEAASMVLGFALSNGKSISEFINLGDQVTVEWQCSQSDKRGYWREVRALARSVVSG